MASDEWRGAANRLSTFNDLYRFTIRCLHCSHERSVQAPFLKKLFKGSATLGVIGKRFRCSACGRRGARLEPYYWGPYNKQAGT